eukprot:scaffold8366_cov121-Isochrysis_galbana.AAC.7
MRNHTIPHSPVAQPSPEAVRPSAPTSLHQATGLVAWRGQRGAWRLGLLRGRRRWKGSGAVGAWRAAAPVATSRTSGGGGVERR